MSVSDVGAGLYCCESVLVAGAVLGSAGPGPLSLSLSTSRRLPAAAHRAEPADKRRHLGFEVPPPAGQPGTSSPAWKYFNVNCNSMKIGTTRSAPFPSFPSRCPRRPEPPQCRCHASFCILPACLPASPVSWSQELVTWNARNLIFSRHVPDQQSRPSPKASRLCSEGSIRPATERVSLIFLFILFILLIISLLYPRPSALWL